MVCMRKCEKEMSPSYAFDGLCYMTHGSDEHASKIPYTAEYQKQVSILHIFFFLEKG